MRRVVLWRGLDAWRAESATLEIDWDSMGATGTQLGSDPIPYRLDYVLRTGPKFVTERLDIDVWGEGWRRELRLWRGADGTWDCETREHGDAPLAPSGGEPAAVRGALDCDLAFSPLTNLMPIRRERLHQRSGAADLLMAWVSVPDLGLHPSQQRYEHLRRSGDSSIVRFVARDPDFVSDLVLDGDGLVERYPGLAERVPPGTGPTSRPPARFNP